MNQEFLVGVSSDFKLEAAGVLEPVLDAELASLPGISYRFFEGRSGVSVTPDLIQEFDALITLRPQFTTESFAGLDRLTLIARWGVGYDVIDVTACTKANVMLAITGDAVRRPVAEAILTLILALAKKLPMKQQIVLTGRWDMKAQASGMSIRGKTIGSIGLGNIASDMFQLLRPFDAARLIAYDPFAQPGRAEVLGVEMVDLETLFRVSDFVTINCPLNAQTRGLVNESLIGLMKPTAYLVNTARGAIVNQTHLVAALQAGQIAGAALDVFEQEPLPADDPLTQLENVILSPHAMAWSDDLYNGNSMGVCQNILDVFQGNIPQYVVNQDVIEKPGFQSKLGALKQRWSNIHEG